MRPFLIALILASIPAYAGDGYWFRTGQPVKRVDIVYVDVVTCGEHQDALGCFIEVWPGHAGVIVIKRGLPAWIEACVMAHEKRHAYDGDRHLSVRLPFLDCGNGQFVSSEILARLGML